MDENLFIPLAALAIAVSAAVSWLLAKRLGDHLPRAISIVVSGCVPVAMLTLVILIWHEFEYAEYKASGSQDGFMGPLTYIVYGFPVFIAMVVIDLFAAAISPKRS
jgi:hypothetical protein